MKTPLGSTPARVFVIALCTATALTLPQSTRAAPSPAAAPTATAPVPVVSEQAWAAMIQQHVELVVHDGTVTTGTLVAHDAVGVTIIGGHGVVSTLPKSSIVLLRSTAHAVAPAPLPMVAATPAGADVPPRPRKKLPPNGVGLLITGSVMTGVGAIVLFSGAGLAAAKTDNKPRYGALVWAPLLVSGIVHLAVGAPLLVVGAARNRSYREFRERHQLSLSAGPTGRSGASVGLAMRF